MIKRLPPETLKYLLDMYNKIWEEREIPKTWKNAKIKPLLKEGKDPALTNIICKIFERMTNKRLVWNMEKKKKIDEKQVGFRKQRNTIDAISKTTTKIQQREDT